MMNYSSFFDRVKKIDEKQKGIRKKGSFSIFQFIFLNGWMVTTMGTGNSNHSSNHGSFNRGEYAMSLNYRTSDSFFQF